MFGFSLVGLDIEGTGVDALKEPEGGPIVARSKCYGVLASAWNVPDDEQFQRITDGSFAAQFAEMATELPFEFDTAIEPPPSDCSSEDFHAEYLSLFEVGTGGPPCPLYGGVWLGNRMGVMEEVVRFYNYFGLKTSGERRIPPDHLSTELEFLLYLSYREAAAPLPTLAVPYNRAQLDFLDRHPGRWFPKLKERLEELEASAFFTGLVDATARFLAADREHLTEGAGAPATASAKQ